MRAISRLTGVVLSSAAVFLAGCDTTQPLLVDGQVLTLDVSALNASTRQFNAWDFFEDNDADGTPDGETSLWCEWLVDPNDPFSNPEQPVPRDSVPWFFSVEIKVIRAGTTDAVVLTSPNAAGNQFNISQYDPRVTFGVTLGKAPLCFIGSTETPCTDPLIERRFVFINPRRIGRLHRDAVATVINPITAMDPATYGIGQGRCSTFDPGPANLDGGALPFPLPIRKGDTVSVTLVRGPEVPGLLDEAGNSTICGAIAQGAPPDSCAFPPEISASLKLDGLPITPIGDLSTTGTIGSGISFAFTSR